MRHPALLEMTAQKMRVEDRDWLCGLPAVPGCGGAAPPRKAREAPAMRFGTLLAVLALAVVALFALSLLVGPAGVA